MKKINYNFYEGDERQFTFKPWSKNGKSRVYVNDYKGRTIGYINKDSKEFELMDRQGLTNDEMNILAGYIKDYTDNM